MGSAPQARIPQWERTCSGTDWSSAVVLSSAPSLTGPALGPALSVSHSLPPSPPSSPEFPFTQLPFLVGCFDHLGSCPLASKRVP